MKYLFDNHGLVQMPAKSLPAASLSTANRLPADRILLCVNYMICRVLSSVRPVIFSTNRIFSLLSGRPAGRTGVKPEARSDRIEFAILAGDQIVGQRKARQRLEAPGPCFEMRPIGDVEPALGHEHHTAPAADIGDRAIVADEEGPGLDRLVDKRQCRLGARAIFDDGLWVGGAKPRRVAHLGDISGDISDVVSHSHATASWRKCGCIADHSGACRYCCSPRQSRAA